MIDYPIRGLILRGSSAIILLRIIIISALTTLNFTLALASPTIINKYPASGSANIPVTSTVSATFGEAMEPATITTGSVTLSHFLGIKAVAAGWSHTVALKNDGTVVAWGRSSSGQTNVPVGLIGVTAVAAGENHSMALKSDGTVVAWGEKSSGQSTVPDGLNGVIAIAAGRSFTVALKNDGTVVVWGWLSYAPAGLNGVTAIAAGSTHIVALKSDGTVVAWGVDEYGKATVPAGLTSVTAIAAAQYHSLALKSDGTVVAWGYNGQGQIAIPAGLTGVSGIAAGNSHSVALKTDGTVVAWGDNSNGQTSVPAELTGVTSIAAGGAHNIAIKIDGTLVAWGWNRFRQTSVPTWLSGISAIAGGGSHSVALQNDGTVIAWGSSDSSQTAVPAGLGGVTAIAAGNSHTVALKSDGTVIAWGDNSAGQTTLPSGFTEVTAISAGCYHTVALRSDGTVVTNGKFTVPAGLAGVKAVSAGCSHTTALKNDGTVVAWGDGSSGQTSVPVGLSGVTAIASGATHTVALKNDGTVVAWGDGIYNDTTVPPGLSDVIAVAAGQFYSVALRSDGSVVSWGVNYYGQTSIPNGLTDVTAIAGGSSHTIALKNDGTVIAWGHNDAGQTNIPVNPYTTAIKGEISYISDSNTVTFISQSRLPSSATLVARVSTGVRNQNGDHPEADITWNFTTGAYSKIIVDPLSLYAGNIIIGNISTLLPITLKNTGTTSLVANAITIAGLDAGMFSVTPGTCGSLTPTITAGSSCNLNIVFAPTNNGLKSATLQIASNDPTASSLEIPLTGNGITPTNSVSIISLGAGSGLISFSTGGNCSGNCSQTFNSGTIVVLTPTATSGSVFSGWAGCDSVSDNRCTVTMNGEKSITATFNLIPIVIANNPTNGAINLPITSTISASFNEPMDNGSLNTGSITLSYFAGIKAIAAGGSHTVALKNDGTVTAWGTNYSGQTNIPAGLSSVTAIAAGDLHTVALKSNGTVVSWGDNSYRQNVVPFGISGIIAIAASSYHTVALKNDGTVIAWGGGNYPLEVPDTIKDIIAIATGNYHSVAIKNDGTVVAWGLNTNGQTTVPAGLNGIIAVAAGYYHSVALKNDGTVVAWGDNGAGQSSVPNGLTGVIAISAREFYTVALKSDGTVVAWGSNISGQAAVPDGLDGVISIGAGGHFTVALKHDGTVVTWGGNNCGEAIVPSEIRDISAIAAGASNSVALRKDGTVTAWGNNYQGATTIPTGLSDVTAIAAGYSHTVALKNNGTVVAWGNNFNGQTTVPTGLSGVTAISAGPDHTLALKNDGTVVAWGSNNTGQASVPVGLSNVSAIAAGGRHSVALKNDGTIVVWGDNVFGQATIPPGLSGVIAIAAGYYNTMALKSNGTVVVWGWDSAGQATVPAGLSGVMAIAIGQYHAVALKYDGTVVVWGASGMDLYKPPSWLSNVTAIAAGDSHTIALRSDGSLVAWGNNSCGQSSVPTSPYIATIASMVSYNSGSKTATILPFSRLPSSTAFSAKVNTRARSLEGVYLVSDYSWSFTTGAFPELSITPNSLNIGNIYIGSSSSAVPITLQNGGTANLDISSISISGVDAEGFSISTGTCGQMPSSIAPGTSCSVAITFSPESQGNKTATLLIASNDPVSPAIPVFLSGSGYDSPPFGNIVINNGTAITNNTLVNLTLTAFDNSGIVSEMRFSNNNSSWSNWELFNSTKSWALMTLAGDGVKTVYVQFKDGAGNTSGSFSSTIYLDTTPPVVTFTSKPSSFYNATSGNFSFSANEIVTGYECKIDSGNYSSCFSPKSFSGLPEGSHTFSVRATDLAGNTGNSSYTWIIDTTPPGTTITNQPNISTNSTSATFSFVSPDSSATFECLLDSGMWTVCTSDTNITGLSVGDHVFNVRAKDAAGNADLNPANYAWTIIAPTDYVAMTVGGITTYFTTLDAAFAVIPSGAQISIKTQNLSFTEAMTLNVDNSVVTLVGGYENGFSAATGKTTVSGSLIIRKGTLVVSNLVIKAKQ